MDLTMFFALDEAGLQVLATRPRVKAPAKMAELAIATEQWCWFDAYQAWQAEAEALLAREPQQARDPDSGEYPAAFFS
ncbi:hypothetical protein FCL40_07335 [Ferrimonas sediminicola]|uniref:Uncharacterized protein n=1 Tax=Ferrimonas sediminicola TaxID=2569538 RepID=A0A4U1BHJ4_9GAMM|nr:hypothetical protein [Ferrimonas sediminicola]TKB49955.1 hypothetical protein FCL40_07335 [Ferrimonas sediminicola]